MKSYNNETWDYLNTQIVEMMKHNRLSAYKIKESINGELNELTINFPDGIIETLFYGNGEAFITVEHDGQDYEFTYVIDTYSGIDYIVAY